MEWNRSGGQEHTEPAPRTLCEPYNPPSPSPTDRTPKKHRHPGIFSPIEGSHGPRNVQISFPAPSGVASEGTHPKT
ncbi:Protein of unknown function [Pyronema omphalodes CBS 100304]|uniref:Uncharacterized protein n=1 Tax=Pyronema omphalodes (strain CBS 100304) TaxID=1076935 RepID=U4LUI5_PYROM|nr:Protein of unknown function [Pyronema omphalodes CBS 100304]